MALNKEVQGYYPSDWQSSGTEYKQINYSSVSTIVYGYLNLNGDGTFYPSSGYNPGQMVSYAHSNGVKVTLQIAASASAANSLLSNNTAMDNAVNNIFAEVQKYNLDGVDNDMENFSSASGFETFQSKIANKFWSSSPTWSGISKYHLTMAIRMDSFVSNYSLNTTQNYVDYVMPMGYDWYGDWNGCAGPNSPMYIDGTGGCLGVSNWGITNRIHYIETLMNKNKIILGVPYYGYLYPTVSNARYSSISSGGTVKEISYKNYVNQYTNPTFDSTWETPWYVYQDTNNQWWQAHFDNLQSLGVKYDFVNSEGLSGIGIWNLFCDLGRTDLANLIKTKFGVINATLTVNPSKIDLGQQATFAVNATGGTAPYTYQW